ncbi:chemotaxis protein CheW [Glaciecola sp. XM2]|jgi:purine-binding chemotaxis protein CheW|uniref:chemotaxis protein CheW n=1 Tax=Glaciecola sp. XM2 TaxID=1914931 RepID=UPI001BDE557D|nr:chemotaxis protein CheW [Glaciecola sp. XM2]MBT1450846.1 chemotaxis protein CheW [Glaciecola sp. XM2]
MQYDKAKQAVADYLTDLVVEDAVAPSDDIARANKLLEQANELLLSSPHELESLSKEPLATAHTHKIANELTIGDKEFANLVETIDSEDENTVASLKDKLPARFQALFFEVAGLTLAIPLVELGGIVKMQELSKLPNTPDWLLGVMVRQQERLHCVNTAQWVMPEKYDAAMAASVHYNYVVQLGKSSWAMACETLASTHELTHDDIKWRSQEHKRPWLAGTIKQKMCALIDATQLVKMLQPQQPNNAKSVVTE